jgi:hypothetical protein
MRVALDDRAYAGGEAMRARVFGEGAFRWALTWRARGPQPATDTDTVVAEGRGVAVAAGTPIEARLPDGPAPSYTGTLVEVAWRLDVWAGAGGQPVRTEILVVAGPAPRRLDPWIARWRGWKRRRAGGMAAASLFFVGVGVAVVAAAGFLAVGAVFLPPVQAVAIFAFLALAGIGAFATVRESGPWIVGIVRGRARMRVTPGPVALLGGEINVAVRTDARRAMAAGGLAWTLRCVERAATRSTWSDRGQTRERYEWAVRVVTEATGTLAGPPYGDRRFTVPIPREAPPTLIGEHREIRWEIEVRCGEDGVEEQVFVAPFGV